MFFKLLIMVPLFYSSIALCSASSNAPQEKEFTFERKTGFLGGGGTGLVLSLLRLKNNITDDYIKQYQWYTLNKDKTVVTVVKDETYVSSTKMSKELSAIFSNVSKFYLRGNTKPNFNESFDLDDIPQEHTHSSQKNVNDILFQNPKYGHIIEFLKEYQSFAEKQKQSQSKCEWLKETVQQCITQ